MPFQIGAAPVTPETNKGLSSLLLLPVQTAVKYSGVYPIVQLSSQSSVVPVLTDTVLSGI